MMEAIEYVDKLTGIWCLTSTPVNACQAFP
ncbi:MAG: hypothetical protein ACJASS_001719 [Sulfitobacter sp.]|jgi:hypothetical protein